jgi:hypothetical protein
MSTIDPQAWPDNFNIMRICATRIPANPVTSIAHVEYHQTVREKPPVNCPPAADVSELCRGAKWMAKNESGTITASNHANGIAR